MTDGSGRAAGSTSPSRRETLRRLLEERAVVARYPLSLQQERLWVAHQLDPDDPSQNVRTALEIRGTLERSLLERSVERLVGRHEQLRARFPSPGGEPKTEIRSLSAIEPEVLRPPAGVTSPDDPTVAELLAESASRPFDLESGPPMRWALLELDDDRSIALFVFHHIVCDAWSVNLFLRELLALLAADRAGRDPELAPIESSYAEFVNTQRALLRGEALERLESFWREQLQGASSAPAEGTGSRKASRRQAFRLPAELTGKLEALARQRGMSLYMVLLAAFAALLARLTGEPDQIVASPVANRPRESWESLVGYFVNLLPLRIPCAEDTEFRQLLDEVRRRVLAAHAHQELPTHRIAQAAGIRQPALLEVLFQHSGEPVTLPKVDGLELSIRGVDVRSAHTRVALATHLASGRLAGTLEYGTANLDATAAERLLDDLHRVLEQITSDDGITLDRLDVPARWHSRSPIEERGEERSAAARAAAAPSHEPSPASGSADAPSQPVRKHLGAIWRAVLGVDEIGPFDNFLDVGGDSLAALQIIERVETELGVRLTPAELFTQTLAQLATLCERRRE